MTQTTSQKFARIHKVAFSQDRPWSEDEFKTLLSHKDVWYCEEDPGFILFRVILDEAEILTLAVHPDHQGHGVGCALVQRAKQKARANGAVSLFLEVAADNAPALGLYERQGFVETGRRPAYYNRTSGPAVDAVLMRAALTKGQTSE